VAGVVGVGVALLAANQGLLLDENAFPRIAHSPEPPPRYPEWTNQGPAEWGY